MESPPPAAATHEAACERVASLFLGRWLRYYVASKLRSDPVFQMCFEAVRGTREPLLDLGCGVGLLPFYLRERGFTAGVKGLDADARKIRKARSVAATNYLDLDFSEHDVREALPPFRGNVAVLDLLHYLDADAQRTLLKNLAAYLPPGGFLLVRDSPRERSLRFWLTYAGEFFAQMISWNLSTPLHFPTRALLHGAIGDDNFSHEESAAWGGTPFNNRLFIFRRKR